MAKLPTDSNPNKAIEDLALCMTVICVRNTVIENYHAEGKLSDPEMREFNKEVANRIYTVLRVLYDSQLDQAKDPLFRYMEKYLPTRWDRPHLDPKMLNGVNAEIDAIIERELNPPTTKKGFLFSE